MKNLYKIFLLTFLGTGLFSCTPDEIDTTALTDFAPGIQRITPSDGGSVVQGDFNITVVYVDGTISPLSEGTVALLDEGGDVVTTITKSLSGTADSIVVEGSTFNASSLDLGSYTIKVIGKDVNNQIIEKTTTFTISDLPFPANNKQMFIAGGFNGWGADELTLIADNTWEIKNIDLKGEEWKFKNTPDWSDADWGDSNCDGIMEITTGGGANTNCAYSGFVNVQFNDNTLRYTIKPSVEYETNLLGLVLLGTFNDFEGAEYKFTLVDDHKWELGEVRLKAGDKYKFAEYPTFQGRNYGDAEGDGKAELFGPNIAMENDALDGFYKVTFNDKSLQYTVELVRLPFPDQLFLVGGATPIGWDAGASKPFMKTGDGYFEIFSPLTVGNGYKFLEVQDWAGDWGSKAGSVSVDGDGVRHGELVQDREENADVDADGFYRLNMDFVNFTYTVSPSEWGVIGSATPGGWDNDTDMVKTGDYTWSVTLELIGGSEIKFRENDKWDVNFGDNDANGSVEKNGDNIAITESGNYTVTLIFDPAGYTYELQKN